MKNTKRQNGLLNLNIFSRAASLADTLRSAFSRPSVLVLHNDDKNEGHWVSDKISSVLGIDKSDAFKSVYDAHHKGSTILFTGTKAECSKLAKEIRNCGPDTRFFEDAEPIKVTVESK